MRTRITSLNLAPVPDGPYVIKTSTPPEADPTIGSNNPSSETRLVEGEEYIEDNPDSLDRSFKYVLHRRQQFVRRDINIDNSIRFDGTNLTRFIYEGPNAFWWAWQHFGKINHSEITCVFDKTEQQVINAALHNFNSVNQVDNLLNIVESPDLITGLRNIRRRSTLLGKITGGFLYWSFGVAPLLSDMKKLTQALSSIRDEARKHSERIGKPVTVHAQSYGSLSISPVGVGYEDNPGGSGWWSMGRILYQQRPVQIVTIKGIRDQTQWNSKSINALDYFVKRYGYTGPATFLWEKVPFSFVLDWFVDLKGVLDALDQSYTGTNHRVLQASHSIKWDISIPIVKNYYNAEWQYNDEDGQQVGINNLKYYLRKPIKPTYSVELNSRFGKKQLAITGALLYEIIANLRSLEERRKNIFF